MRLSRVLVLGLFAVTSACGSGGTGGSVASDPDSSLTQADLDEAGVPSLPLLSASGGGGGGGPSCGRLAVVDAADYVTLRNLIPTAEGFVTGGIPANVTSRVVAWAMYEIPTGPGTRTRSLSINFSKIELAFAPAIGNFTEGRWEIGEPVELTGAGGLDWFCSLSTSQRYDRSDGRCFLLLLVLRNPVAIGHNGGAIHFGQVRAVSHDVTCLREGFDEDTPGAVDWGDGRWDFVGEGYLGRQSFDHGTADRPTVAFVQPVHLDLLASTEHFFFQSLAGDFDDDGTVDAADYVFFDPAELNGSAHPYDLATYDPIMAEWSRVNVAPLVPPEGGGPASTLMGVLLPFLGRPASPGEVRLIDAAGNVLRSATVERGGGFALPDVDLLPLGEHFLVGTDGGVWRLRLEEEEGIFYVVVEP